MTGGVTSPTVGQFTGSGNLTLIDYDVTDDGILFAGLFLIERTVSADQHG